MFKELKSLGVVVKELSNELRQLVREESRRLVAGGTRLPARASLRASVVASLCRQCVCALVRHSHRHTLNFQLFMVFQMLHHHKRKTDKWTKEPAEEGWR